MNGLGSVGQPAGPFDFDHHVYVPHKAASLAVSQQSIARVPSDTASEASCEVHVLARLCRVSSLTTS